MMLGLGPDSVVPWANPRRRARLAPVTAAVDFRKSLRFIVDSPMDEMKCVAAGSETRDGRRGRRAGLRSVAGGAYLCDEWILRWALRGVNPMLVQIE